MNTTASVHMKEFHWDNEKLNKGEYHEWYALLRRNLSTRGIVYCLNADHTALYRPTEPIQPADPDRQDSYERLKASYDAEMRRFHASFDPAIGLLRSSFTYASKAANDLELALQVVGSPEIKFRNALARL